MELQTISLLDRARFAKYLSLKAHKLGVFSFANIFTWRAHYAVRWTITDKALYVFFTDKFGTFLYLPPLARKITPKLIHNAFNCLAKLNSNAEISRIENIEEQDLEVFINLGFKIYSKPGDYFYLGERLSGLNGNAFKSKRVDYNYFVKHEKFNVSLLNEPDFSNAFLLYREWQKERSSKTQDPLYRGMLEDSYAVLKEALKHYAELGFKGIAVRINNELKAFTFGYALNKETFVIFFEVVDLEVKGLAQFVFRQFCRYLNEYKYINCLDDSGLDNLKRVKLSYRPLKLVKAFIAQKI